MPPPAAQPLVKSWSVRLMMTGTPSATPEYGPKLGRMSLRTTPESINTLGPMEPSPGKGPVVSAGVAVAHAAAPAGWGGVDARGGMCCSPRTHAASADAPAAPARYKTWRLDRLVSSTSMAPRYATRRVSSD